MKTILIGLLVLLQVSNANAAAPFVMPTKGLQLCMSGGGVMAVKVKCKANETKVTMSGISESVSTTPQCRVASTQTYTSDSVAAGNYMCNSGEYMMTYGWYISETRLTGPRQAKLLFSGETAMGVQLIIQGETGVGYYGSNYTLNVNLVCCLA